MIGEVYASYAPKDETTGMFLVRKRVWEVTGRDIATALPPKVMQRIAVEFTNGACVVVRTTHMPDLVVDVTKRFNIKDL
jgi:hypothetical protein